jgi:hypothetical protein
MVKKGNTKQKYTRNPNKSRPMRGPSVNLMKIDINGWFYLNYDDYTVHNQHNEQTNLMPEVYGIVNRNGANIIKIEYNGTSDDKVYNLVRNISNNSDYIIVKRSGYNSSTKKDGFTRTIFELHKVDKTQTPAPVSIPAPVSKQPVARTTMLKSIKSTRKVGREPRSL